MHKKRIIIAVVAVAITLGIALFAYLNYELSFAKPPVDADIQNIMLKSDTMLLKNF